MTPAMGARTTGGATAIVPIGEGRELARARERNLAIEGRDVGGIQ